ncbi:MAG: carbohydrate ABC transporter permease, partial [Chloroflexota bacterium]
MQASGSETHAGATPRPRRTARLAVLLDREDILGYLLVTPTVIIVLGLVGYPFVLAILLSFTDKTIGAPAHFIGFENFIQMAQDSIYRESVRNTLVYTVGSEALKIPIGFVLALILNEKIPFRKVIRSGVLLPWIVPAVLSAMAWTWLFNPNFSVLNWILI